jgi:hypothetical protein
MLFYRLLADLVVVAHFAYVGFVVFGMAAILVGGVLRWHWVRNFWFRVLHLVAIALVAGQALAGILCPLTTLENMLRLRAGQATYPAAFIGYWAHRLMFYRAPGWVFTLCYSLFALAVAGALILIPPRWPKKEPGPSKGKPQPPV